MIVAIIILFIFVVLELLLILGLAGRQEETRRSIKEINDFLEKYTEKNQKSNEKMTEAIGMLTDKVIKIWKALE